jgi:hypothetical protein
MKLILISRQGVAAICVGTALSLTTAQAGILKASPAPPSAFLEHPETMTADPVRTPFDKVWRNPSPAAWERVKDFDRIVIMPVNTTYLRTPRLQHADAQAMAAYMHEEFQKAFAQGGQHRVMLKPGPKTLELELALVEVKPSNVPGNVLNTGAGVVIPGANLVGGQLTHGTIAFEGKLRNSQTGELLAEYADRQNDKITMLSFRDYAQYAHDRKAIQDWARQMQQLASTPLDHKVPGAMRVTLNPF